MQPDRMSTTSHYPMGSLSNQDQECGLYHLEWDQKTLLVVQGIPGKLTMSDDSHGVDIEQIPMRTLMMPSVTLQIPKPQTPEPWTHPASKQTKE